MSVSFLLANVAGVAAIAWPLVLSHPVAASEGGAHAADAPVLVALLVPLLVLTAMSEARRNHGDARLIALLGTLAAVNAVLRIPKGPTGEGLMFPLPILCGWAMGASFGFLLGAFSLLVSAVITGGVGPWLPFQMFALGWVGMGAGALRRVTGDRLFVLVAYAYVASLLYGFATTLWFWPFLGGDGATFFKPGLGLRETLARYWRFYLLTSLAWDTGRALLVNVPLVAILARPVGALLARTRDRFAPTFSAVGG